MRIFLFTSLLMLSTAALAQPSSQPIQTNQESAPNTAKRGVIVDRVEFSRGSSTIAKADYVVLDEVAKILNERPDIILFEVQGHADPTTEGLYADKLSQKRANAVKKYLVARGVDPERIVAIGYAAKLPLTTGKSAKDRAKNRRIEMNVAKKSE